MLTALSKAEGLRSALSFVIAAYFYVRLIPQDLRALHLNLFSLPFDLDFLRNHQFYLGKNRKESTQSFAYATTT